MNSINIKRKAQAGVVSFFVGAMIALIIALQVVWPVFDDIIYTQNAATGTLTLTGNSYCGDMVNVTNVAGIKVTLFVNVTGLNCAAPPAWVATVAIASPDNSSTGTATNISTAINANASINATMTAANPSAGVVTLAYKTAGTTGNSVATTESMANGSWSAATLTGGTNSNIDNMSTASQTLVNLIPLFLVLLVLMIFIRPLL